MAIFMPIFLMFNMSFEEMVADANSQLDTLRKACVTAAYMADDKRAEATCQVAAVLIQGVQDRVVSYKVFLPVLLQNGPYVVLSRNLVPRPEHV